MHDGGTDLTLDVVTDDRQRLLLEPRSPLGLAGDEHRDAVHEPAPGLERRVRVELHRLLATDRQEVDEHVGLRILERLHDVDRLGRRELDDVAEVLADAVEGRAALHGDAGRGDLGEAHGVVLTREDRLGEVDADLGLGNVERGDELDVTDVVAGDGVVHEARHLVGGVGVVRDTLNEARGAISDASDGDADGTASPRAAPRGVVRLEHGSMSAFAWVARHGVCVRPGATGVRGARAG